MMETPSSFNEDRLSSLPTGVIDIILMRLPIKDAVRTSILSCKWRYRWTAIPQLVFNKKCTPSHSRRNSPSDHIWRVNIVDQVLLRHKGPIHKFHCSRYLQSCPDIDRWILFLSNHGIKEFILQCSKGNPYKVPSHLFSCQDLHYLELSGCIIKPPPTISQLVNLKALVLRRITSNDEALKNLLLKCKFLEDLRLTDFEGLSHLEVLAPNLKRISIAGSFQGLCLDTPLLASASIDLLDSVEEEEDEVTESCVCNLIRALGRLGNLQKLELENHCLKFLASGKVPLELKTTYKNLKYLCVSIDFYNVKEISAACCLIKSAPYLEHLKIQSTAEEELFCPDEFAWETPGLALNHLQSMEMTRMMGEKSELDVLEFVLAHAPMLSTMTVQIRDHIYESAILRSLIRFRRASTQATIISVIEDE